MVSFSCNACQDTLKKPKLVQHFQRCYAPFTCLDCNREMWDGEFQKHTTCISEAEKYEKTLYKGDKKKGKGQQQQQQHAQQQQSQKQPPSASAQVQPSKTEQPVASTSTIPAPEASINGQVNGNGEASVFADSKKKDKKRKRKDAEKAEADPSEPAASDAAANVLPGNGIDKEPNGDASGVLDDAEEKKRRKKAKKDKKKQEKAARLAMSNGDVATSEETAATLRNALQSAIVEKGTSASLAQCLANIPLDRWPEILGTAQVQSGTNGDFILSF